MVNDVLKYADVFYGNGETDRFFDDGIASKWFYIKAQCGNTLPHATLPFCKMSVGPYSGGYPGGYGTHYPNSCGGIRKLGDVHTVRGFSHVHHSGVGGIKYYYNYAITTPFYGELSEIERYLPLTDEKATPGYYSAKLGKTLCEMTVDGGCAIHRYTFSDDCGHIVIDFSNDGLSKKFGDRFFSYVKDASLSITSGGDILCSGVFSGIKLYFCARAEGTDGMPILFYGSKECPDREIFINDEKKNYGVKFDLRAREAVIRVSYSTVSFERALEEIERSSSFDVARAKAENIWREALSKIKVESDDVDLLTKFYSNLYHSLIKPADMTGETVLGIEGDLVTDFATFWDQYKTLLPLIYLSYPEMGDKVARCIVNMSRSLGKIPCSLGLTDIFSCEEQAKMLGVISLCDAYHLTIPSVTKEVIEECVERELMRDDYREFSDNGFFKRYTHILDVADAAIAVSDIIDESPLRERLIEISQCWRKAYGENSILSENSEYYEGDKYTYSFRIGKTLDERIALAGGKERYTEMLDRFFGFSGESVKQITYVGADDEISRKTYHRFEGFNNECDMETPYAYIYTDRHDRLDEIMRECVDRSFGLGRSALPGNNDSGGLSSYFLFAALGIFPVAGFGEFLIGSPRFDTAKLSLAREKELIIKRVLGESGEDTYVKCVSFNGKPLEGFKISASEIAQGGELCVYMK